VMTLDLDARQRAMLQEMHIPVWWPAAHAVQAEATVAEPPAVRRAVPTVAAREEPDAREARSAPAAPVTPVAQIAPPTPQRAERPSGIETMGWVELQQAVAGCTACKLCSTRKNTVFGVGPAAPADGVAPRADWMIVGEAPGENEDIKGEPFVGQAGKLLDGMLNAIGLKRGEAVYIANVVKCRPPGNRTPTPEEARACAPFLDRQLELIRPKLIVALGKTAAMRLLGTEASLGSLRGRVHRYKGIPLVVTYHPAYLLRSLTEKAKAWEDLLFARRTLREAA